MSILKRFTVGSLQCRESDKGESRTIEGKAIAFNVETTLWDGKYFRDREMISPSCIPDGWLETQDVKLNLLHKRDATLCRSNKGVGTLKMEKREDGVWFTAEMPKCDLGDRALALVANGTYSGCSFEFAPGDKTETVTKLEDGREDIFTIFTSFESLSALTIAMDPAYEQTEVAVKEREREEQREREEKRESENPQKNNHAVSEREWDSTYHANEILLAMEDAALSD